MPPRLLIRVLVLAGVVAVAGGLVRAQDPPAAPPPAPGQEPYVAGRGGATLPRAIARVNPAYTPEAVRARIQGAVRLRGIVERDGTISNIEVQRSLDTMYGLDAAAVNALKQWRFEPGTVNGQPVRVLITVDLTFTLAGSRPGQTWPVGFDAAAAALDTVDETAETGGLRLTIARPANWTIRRAGPPSEWVAMRSSDGTEQVAVLRAQPASFDLAYPVAETLMQRVAESVRRSQPPEDTAVTLGMGQVQARSGTFWIWSSMRVPAVLPPPGVAADANPYGEARVWLFSHTVGGLVVGVLCQLVLPRNVPDAEANARAVRATAAFGAIVNSIRIDITPG